MFIDCMCISHRVIYVYSLLSEQRSSEDILQQINLKFNVTTWLSGDNCGRVE